MRNFALLAIAAASLSACAAPIPRGPSIVAIPPAGRDFGQFQREDAFCQQSASNSLGLADPGAGNQAALGSAAVGTALGAVAGGLIGAATGNFGAGVAIGAGAGLLTGSAVGVGAAQNTNFGLQERFDITYAQCMAALGNSVQPLRVAVPVPVYQPVQPFFGPPVFGPPVFGFGYSRHYGRGYHRRW